MTRVNKMHSTAAMVHMQPMTISSTMSAVITPAAFNRDQRDDSIL